MQKSDAEKLLQEKNAELTLVKNDLTNARLTILNINKKNKEMENELTRLTAATQSNASSSQNIMALQNDKAELERKIGTLLEQNRNLKQEIADSSTQKMTLRVRELKAYMDKLKRENKDLQMQLNTWRRKITKIEGF